MKTPKVKIIEFSNSSEFVAVIYDGKYYLWTKQQLALAYLTVKSTN